MIQRLKAYRLDAVLVAGFIILPLLLYWQVTVGPQTMIPADNLYQWAPWEAHAGTYGAEVPENSLISDLVIQNYPWKGFLREAVAQREIPLWNPYLFGGAPFLATGQNSSYYPFTLLFLILPLTKAYGWFALSQLWLAGVAAYIFLRVLGLRRRSGFLGGIVYQGSGFMIVSAAVFPMIIAAAAWLPLLLVAIELVIRRSTTAQGAGKTMPAVVLGAGVLGVQVLAGHPEITYYSLLVMGFYTAWRLLGRWQTATGRRRPLKAYVRPAGWLLAMVLLGLMLGAVQFIPLFEVGQANFRSGSASLAEIRGWAFPERRALTLAMPDFFGNPSHQSYVDVFSGDRVALTTNAAGELNPNGAYTTSWGIKNYVEGGIYLGILPLLLALLGAWGGAVRGWKADGEARSRALFSPANFFTLLSVLALAFIFGTPLYALLYYGLPFIDQLHSPFRWVFPLSLAVAYLAAHGLNQLLDDRPVPRPARWLSAGALLSGGLVLAGLAVSRLFYGRLESTIERVFLGLAKAPEAFPNTVAFYSYELRNALFFGVNLLFAGGAIWLLRRRPRAAWIAAALLLVDLVSIGYGFNAAVDPALLEFTPEMVRWLEEQPGQWRITSFAPKSEKPFNANSGWIYDLQDIRGYDSIILKEYVDYMETIEPQGELLFNRIQPIKQIESLNSPLLDLLTVRYIITRETLDLPKLEQVWEGEGVRIYENLAVAPRAFTLPRTATLVSDEPLAAMQTYDPRQVVVLESDEGVSGPAQPQPAALTPAEVAAYGLNEVTLRTAVTEPSWVVLADTYLEGWRAFVRPAGGGAGDDGGEEIEVFLHRVNGIFRGVELEPGQWEIRFRYSPLTFQLGGLTSLMAGIILAFGTAVWAWRRFYRPAREMTNTLSIAKNSVVPMVLNLFNRSIDFFFAMFYLRQLGPADAGGYATAIAIAGFYEIMANFGLNTYLIREVSVERERAGRYLLNTTILRISTGMVAALPIFLYVALRGQSLGRDIIAAVLFLMVGMILSGMGQGLTGLFYAYELAERPAAVATVTTILKVGFGVVVLLLGFGFVGLASVSIAVNLVTLGILTLIAFRQLGISGSWDVDWSLQRRMIVASYPLMINHLLATVFFRIDVLMLQQINGDQVVGWYNSAYKWVDAFNIIPSFFTFALFPIISRQVQSNIGDARRTFRMSVKLLLLVALPLAATIMLAAPFLIGVLGGSEFLPDGALVLQIVIWSIPFGWINSVTNYTLVALGQERVMSRAFVIGVLFNVITNALLLPRYGYVAAAATTIASEIVLLAVFNHYLRPRMADVAWGRLVIRPVLVATGALAVMLLATQLHWIVGIAVGLLLYGAGLWFFGVFGEEERRILEQILPAPLASRLGLEPAGR